MIDPRLTLDPNVAQIDQSRAEALDALRTADSWLLLLVGDDGIEAYSIGTTLELIACQPALEELIHTEVAGILEECEEA